MREGYNRSPFPLLAMTSSRSPSRGSIRTRGFGRAILLAGQAKVKAVGNQITEFAFGLRARAEKENRYEVSRKRRVGHWHSCFARERLSCHRLQR